MTHKKNHNFTKCVAHRYAWFPGTFVFILSLMMKFLQAFQSPVFMARDAATMCSLMLSGGPVRVWRSLIRSTWWKFLLIILRRASISWAEVCQCQTVWVSHWMGFYHTSTKLETKIKRKHTNFGNDLENLNISLWLESDNQFSERVSLISTASIPMLTDLPCKVSPWAWRRRGRHTRAAPGWCACGTAADDASQSSPAPGYARADAAAAGPADDNIVQL